MQRRQLILSREPLDRKRTFLQALYGERNLPASWRFHAYRQKPAGEHAFSPDPTMTLERHLALLSPSDFLVLQIGDPDLNHPGFSSHKKADQGDQTYAAEDIKVGSMVHEFLDGGAHQSRIAWFSCPLNERSYETLNKVFRRAFECAIPVYKQR